MTVTVDVDIDLDDIDFDDLCEYIESQGYTVVASDKNKLPKNKDCENKDYEVSLNSTDEDHGTSFAKWIREANLDVSRTFMRALIAELTCSPKSSDPDALCAKLRELL